MNKIIVVAESSWDIECLKKQGFEIKKAILHNDYFSKKKNSVSTKKINRVIASIKIFFFVLTSCFKRESIIFSSFNLESFISAWFFSKKKNTYLFCSNVMASPDKYNDSSHKRLKKVMDVYRGRILVTDIITKQTLKEYKPILTKNYFNFNLPAPNIAHELTYIIVMPAVLSHNETKSKSNDFYFHAIYILNWLEKNKFNYKILPHPREEGLISNTVINEHREKFITGDEIAKLGSMVCYLSSFSSLSLNKRYGGEYGFWVKVPNIDILPASLPKESTFLLDIINE